MKLTNGYIKWTVNDLPYSQGTVMSVTNYAIVLEKHAGYNSLDGSDVSGSCYAFDSKTLHPKNNSYDLYPSSNNVVGNGLTQLNFGWLSSGMVEVGDYVRCSLNTFAHGMQVYNVNRMQFTNLKISNYPGFAMIVAGGVGDVRMFNVSAVRDTEKPVGATVFPLSSGLSDSFHFSD